MFIRSKPAARNDRTYVQLVESYRENGKVKQRVIRHVGTADSKEKQIELEKLALTIKMEIEAKSSVTNAAKPHYTKECGSTVALKKQHQLIC